MTTPAAPVSVGPATDDRRYLATEEVVWFEEPSAAPVERQLASLPPDRRFAAEVEGADAHSYPGVYGVYPLDVMVPGSPDGTARSVPAAGLTWVGVHPDHRRRGVLSAMMRDHLERVHVDPRTALSVLHASEPSIYGRFGYGPASLEMQVELGSGTTFTAPGLDQAAAAVTTHLVEGTREGVAQRLRECHRRWAGMGEVVLHPEYYVRAVDWMPEELRDREPPRVLFAQQDGADVGFALVRRAPKWERGRHAGRVDVWCLVGSLAAQLALARRLVAFDLVSTVVVKRVGPDHPLLLWVGGPRGTADLGTFDSLWVRLVDLPRALEARAWSAPCDVVVEVADTHAPWNAGVWRLRADGSGAVHVERTTRDADLRMPVEALGAAYLGGGNLVAQQVAGLVEERRVGATAELWRALRTPVSPHASFGF
jgi:GNAT superfamily N-acetyltransferase